MVFVMVGSQRESELCVLSRECFSRSIKKGSRSCFVCLYVSVRSRYVLYVLCRWLVGLVDGRSCHDRKFVRSSFPGADAKRGYINALASRPFHQFRMLAAEGNTIRKGREES